MTPFLASVQAALEGAAGEPGPAWLRDRRRRAGERFLDLGLPTPRDEAWRYTNLSALAQLSPDHLARPAPEGAPRRGGAPGLRLVFLDGALQPDRSSLGTLAPGLKVTSLGVALAEAPERAERLLGAEPLPGHPFAALALALARDGALVEVPPGLRLEEPLELLFLHSAEGGRAAHYHTVVSLGEGSALTLVERHAGAGGAPTLTNALLEVRAGEGARLEHLRLQEEGPSGWHVGLLSLAQGARSRVASRSVALGGALSRLETHAELRGEDAECVLDGLYLGQGRQVLDQVVTLDHVSPRCVSRERFKGILDGEARGVFSGRIRVREGAQRTDAEQVSSSLLLSEDAQADARPQLEILADDVKCSHGGAIGQLSEEALFYLRSRGIDREAARSLLTYAFASELVDRVPAPLRPAVRRSVAARLPGAGLLAEAA